MTMDELATAYATPDDVAETMGLPPEFGGDTYGFTAFSDSTVPSYDQVCRMILSNEDVIDRRIRRSWRVNRVKDQICTISTYWHDINAWRSDYYQRGGNYVQLRKDILPWDPTQGDRIELRGRGNTWRDFTFARMDSAASELDPDTRTRVAMWFDYASGRLFLRTSAFQMPYNAVRISYRYGSEEEPPYSIKRLCCLMTASQVISMSVFAVKVGAGGDLAGIRQDLQKMWQEEMNSIWSSWQRSGTVHSILG